jgi:predicted DsbA family dithiol-disulfide isomerase
MTKPTVAVDIWSDVMCPWCAVGYTQFAKSVKQLEGELDVVVRWMPFELNPDRPREGKLQDRHLAEVYGRSPDEIAAMRAQMQATAARAACSTGTRGIASARSAAARPCSPKAAGSATARIAPRSSSRAPTR